MALLRKNDPVHADFNFISVISFFFLNMIFEHIASRTSSGSI